MSSITIDLQNADGETIALITKFVALSYTLTTNNISILELIIDGFDLPITNFDRNYRIRITRNGNLEGDAPWFIKFKSVSNTRGAYRIAIIAFHSNWLLKTRSILYYTGSTGARVSNIKADDLIKRIVRQNLGSLSQTATAHVSGVDDNYRDIVPTNLSSIFTVATDTGQASVTSMSYPRRKMLDVLNQIAQDSYQAGTPLFFGIEENSSGLLEFRTRTEQWRDDKTTDLVISPEFSNLDQVMRTWDWTEEGSVAVALGQGNLNARAVSTTRDTTITDANILNWNEVSLNSSQSSNTTELNRAAASLLYNNRVKESFSGVLQDTESFKYGRDWKWGDRLTAHYLGEEIDCWANVVTVSIADGKESISAQLEVIT